MLNALQTLIALLELKDHEILDKDDSSIPEGFGITSRPGRDVLLVDVAAFRDIIDWALHNQADAAELVKRIDERPPLVKIVRMVQTCCACPSQWDGWDELGGYYYFRYRHGYLRVSTRCDAEQEVLYEGSHEGEGGSDGVMSYDQLRWILRDILRLPQSCEYT